MKKLITIFCISMSFILCGIMVNKNFSLSDEVNTMTMTELYESGASSAKDMVITIESKEELILFNKYLEEEKKTEGFTFCLTKDIYWSDYEFRYNEKSDRMGVYKNGSLEVVYGWEWEMDEDENDEYFILKEYKDYETEEENSGEKYQFNAEFWTPAEKALFGNFDGNGHTIYGLLLKGPFLSYVYNADIMNLTLTNVYSENGEGILVKHTVNENVTKCNMKNCFVYRGKDSEDSSIGMIGEFQDGNIKNCEADVCCIFESDYIVSFGVLIGSALSPKKIDNNIVHGKVKIRSGIYVGGLTGCISYGDFIETDYEVISCKSSVDIDNGKHGVAGISNRIYISGYKSKIKIEKCFNEGTFISKYNDTYMAGIVGSIFFNGSYDSIKVDECVNKGNIVSYKHDFDWGDGGIIGICGVGDYEIINCINKGNISCLEGGKNSGTGGIIGNFRLTRKSPSKRTQKIENCSNQGNIYVKEGNIGGICNVLAENNPRNSDLSISNSNFPHPKAVEDLWFSGFGYQNICSLTTKST